MLFDQAFNATGNPTLQAEQDLLLPLGDHQHSTPVVDGNVPDGATSVRQSVDYAQFGRVTAIRDASGTLVVDGAGQPDLGAIVTAFAHHGSVTETATGLQLKGERWYSPDLGRFVSEDPIQDGANRYAFAGNDPVSFADPPDSTSKDTPSLAASAADGPLGPLSPTEISPPMPSRASETRRVHWQTSLQLGCTSAPAGELFRAGRSQRRVCCRASLRGKTKASWRQQAADASHCGR